MDNATLVPYCADFLSAINKRLSKHDLQSARFSWHRRILFFCHLLIMILGVGEAMYQRTSPGTFTKVLLPPNNYRSMIKGLKQQMNFPCLKRKSLRHTFSLSMRWYWISIRNKNKQEQKQDWKPKVKHSSKILYCASSHQWVGLVID